MTADFCGRRAALAALVTVLVAPVVPTAAQDPNASMVQSVAREWLVLTDQFDTEGSWKAAGKKFRDAIAPDRWAQSLRSVREPVGQVVQRSVRSTQFSKTIPQYPEGEYAIVVFRSGFEKKLDGGESVTLEREADGRWRVIGYFVR